MEKIFFPIINLDINYRYIFISIYLLKKQIAYYDEDVVNNIFYTSPKYYKNDLNISLNL